MNFKSLKVVLISLTFGISFQSFAETNDEKESRIEGDLNQIFEKAINVAAHKLGVDKKVEPFAIIKKKDGEVGVFQLDSSQTSGMSVNEMTFSVRRYLTELAMADQIWAACLSSYSVVENQGQKAQGLSFEIEHVEGVSMLRFMPVTKKPSEDAAQESKLVLHIESVSTINKPVTVFTDVAKAIAANK